MTYIDYQTERLGQHIVLRRQDGEPIVCGWDMLYHLVSQRLDPEEWAIEVYPPTAYLVDEVNHRHFWVVDQQKLHAACPEAIWF